MAMANIQTPWRYKTKTGIPPSKVSQLKICSKGKFNRRKMNIPSKAQNLRLLAMSVIFFSPRGFSPRKSSGIFVYINKHFGDWKQGNRG